MSNGHLDKVLGYVLNHSIVTPCVGTFDEQFVYDLAVILVCPYREICREMFHEMSRRCVRCGDILMSCVQSPLNNRR